MKIKSLLAALMALVLVPALAFSAPKTLQLGAGDPEDSEQGIAAKAFAEYIDKHGKGELKINNFYNGALGDESEVLRNVQRGTTAFAVAGIANLVPFEGRLGILTLPYLFSNLDEVVKGTNGAASDLLNEYATSKGFRVLTWTYTDFRYISNSKRPIKKLADIRGLKFRVPQSAVLIESYKAFGGSPTPISWGETFTALQQGVVDGQCYGYIGFDTMKFADANQKYITEVHYTYQLQPLVMSERVYKSLTPAQQKLVVDAGKHAQDVVLKYQKEEGAKSKEKLMKAGIVIDKLEDEEAWKKAALEKVWTQKDMLNLVGGKDAINKYLKLAGLPEWK